MSRIANASGFHAAALMAVKNGYTNTWPLVSAALGGEAAPLAPPRYAHLRNDNSPRARRSSIIACPVRSSVAWVPSFF